jgi:hypothetical protein
MSDHAPGWNAINATMATLYGAKEPKFYGVQVPRRQGGPDPLDGVSIFESDKGRYHYHYVTYGFSELYGKESPNRERSGYGIELTFRLMMEQKEPPIWPVVVLQNLARYVFATNTPFKAGDYLDLNGKIYLEVETEIKAILFWPDPELLEPVDTPNGKVQFLQVYGITLEELKAARMWNTEGIVKICLRNNPYLVTDLNRESMTTYSEIRKEIDEGGDKDGASTDQMPASQLDWKVGGMVTKAAQLIIGSSAVEDLKKTLKRRHKFGNELSVIGEKKRVKFTPAAAFNWRAGADELIVQVTADDVAKLSEKLDTKGGDYPVWRNLTVSVVEEMDAPGQGKLDSLSGTIHVP